MKGFPSLWVIVNTAMLAYTYYEMDPTMYTAIYAAQYVITMFSLGGVGGHAPWFYDG